MQIVTKRAILLSDKDFKTKIVTRDKEGHFIRIKMLIHQEDITIIGRYVPNNRAWKYTKEKFTELKGNRPFIIKRIIGEYYEQLYSNYLANLDEIGKS